MAAPQRFRRCIRCMQPTPMDSRVNICVDEERYPLDLCETHAERLHRDLAPYIRGVDPIEHKPPIRFGQAPQPRPRPVAIPRRVVEFAEPTPEPQPALAPVHRLNVPAVPGSDGWLFSDHAIKRLRERELDIDEVLRTAVHPQRSAPGKLPETTACHRDGLIAVVVESRKLIVTAYRDGDPDHPETASLTLTGKRA